MATSALARARRAIADTRKAASARYAKLRETEHGRTTANEMVSTVGAVAAGAMIGSMPEQAVDVWGVSVPYAGIAGLAAYIGGRQMKNATARAAGHGLLTGTVTIMAYESAKTWA
jgi:hypothetical protein